MKRERSMKGRQKARHPEYSGTPTETYRRPLCSMLELPIPIEYRYEPNRNWNSSWNCSRNH